MQKLAALDGVGEHLVKKIAGLWKGLRDMLMRGGASAMPSIVQKAEDSRPYVLLVVPPVSPCPSLFMLFYTTFSDFQALSFLPWECMPLFDGVLVTRVPSFHTFENLLHEIKDVSCIGAR
jgi:hypothetical protein